MQKRQPRDSWKTCGKGCPAIIDPVGACKLLLHGESEEVILSEEAAAVEWPYLFTAAQKLAAKIGKHPDKSANLTKHDLSACNEHAHPEKTVAGIAVPTPTCTTLSVDAKTAEAPGRQQFVADNGSRVSIDHVSSTKDACRRAANADTTGSELPEAHTEVLAYEAKTEEPCHQAESEAHFCETKTEEVPRKGPSLEHVHDSRATGAIEVSHSEVGHGRSAFNSKAKISLMQSVFDAKLSMVAGAQKVEAAAPDFVPTLQKRVEFDLEATSVHEVIPYAEIYGAHPYTFVFDRESQKIPAARGGYVSAASLEEPIEDLQDSDDDDDDSDLSKYDGGCEQTLLHPCPLMLQLKRMSTLAFRLWAESTTLS